MHAPAPHGSAAQSPGEPVVQQANPSLRPARKIVRILTRPNLAQLDAKVLDVAAETICLLLDRPLLVGTVFAVQSRIPSLSASRILSARVTAIAPEADLGWRAYCCLSCRLSDRELLGFHA
jgi:hypothetical protein